MTILGEKPILKKLVMLTGIVLSFKHTRAVGGRASEKKIMEWWGSVLHRELPLTHFKNHFKRNELQNPKPHWTATD